MSTSESNAQSTITRRDALKASLASTALMKMVHTAESAEQKRPRPNVLFLMGDQHRGDCIGADGNRCIITPHLDRLANEGARFRCAYTSVPSCTPARAGILTGLSPWNHGMLGYSRVAEQYPREMPRMLTDSGVDGARVATALTAASLISTGTLFMLPLLTVPAALLGRPVPGGLAQAAWLGGVVFVAAFVFGWRLLFHDRLLRRIGRGAQWLRNRFQRGKAPVTDLPARLVVQRDQIRDALGDTWWKALLFSLGNWLFDYLALLAAITAVGSRPRPTLVLLAYSASMVLAMIPITPGGLGFVEAGLTGLLTLAGVPAGDAVLAVLAYRLVSFWLPLPAGGVAAYLHRRRYRGREAVAEPG